MKSVIYQDEQICMNDACSLKEKCLRYTFESKAEYQRFGVFIWDPIELPTCPWFIDNKEQAEETKRVPKCE